MVVMFVNQWVHCFDVKEPVQYGVEKVVNDKDSRQWQQNRLQGSIPQTKQNFGFVKAIPQQNVQKWTCLCLGQPNEKSVGRTQIIEVFPSDWNAFDLHPIARFAAQIIENFQRAHDQGPKQDLVHGVPLIGTRRNAFQDVGGIVVCRSFGTDVQYTQGQAQNQIDRW